MFTKSCLKIAGKKTVTFIPDIHYPVGKQLLHNAWGKLRGIGSALGVGLAGENIKLGFNRAFSFTFKDMGGQTCVIYMQTCIAQVVSYVSQKQKGMEHSNIPPALHPEQWLENGN